MSTNRMEKHVTFVAAINIAFGILGLIFAIIIFTGTIIAGIAVDEARAKTIVSIAGTAVAFFLAVTSLPEIIGGFGLLKRKPWARILILIVACLDLLFIPIGTIIGIYELWVLLQQETIQLFKNA